MLFFKLSTKDEVKPQPIICSRVKYAHPYNIRAVSCSFVTEMYTCTYNVCSLRHQHEHVQLIEHFIEEIKNLVSYVVLSYSVLYLGDFKNTQEV